MAITGESPKAVAAESRRKVLAVMYLSLNVVSSVSLIMLNKIILSPLPRLNFHYTYCLTFFHVVATVVGATHSSI